MANAEPGTDAIESDASGNAYVEMLFPAEYAKLICDSPPPAGTCARMRCYVAANKKAVVETDTDLFTPEEYRAHSQEVTAALLDELRSG